MTRRPGEPYQVGYKKPPKHSRWKAGQPGNLDPKRRVKKPETTLEVITRLLAEKMEITLDGEKTMMSKLQIITFNLWSKAMKGDLRARRALRMYVALAAMRGAQTDEIVFGDGNLELQPVERGAGDSV